MCNATSAHGQLASAEPALSVQDIKLFINSPGGSVTAGMGIYDAMQVGQMVTCVSMDALHARKAAYTNIVG